MQSSFSIQLLNTGINLIEMCLLIGISYLSFQNYQYTQGRATKILTKLDNLIVLTKNGHQKGN